MTKRWKRRAVIAVVSMLSMIFFVASLQAEITAEGEVSPADPASWTYSTTGYIGEFWGSLTVNGGDYLYSGYVYLGSQSGAFGEMTIDGTKTRWYNLDDLYIGQFGTGSLNVSGGGYVVSGMTTYVAPNPGSAGTINFGAGGGRFGTHCLLASPNQLTGTGTIDAAGLVSDIDLVFDTNHGQIQSLQFNSVKLNLDMRWGSGGALGAGYRGNGSLTVQEGSQVISELGYIGYQAGATGVAKVDGVQSTWTNKTTLSVGNSGSGTLTISAGGTVNDSNGYVGYNAGSTGAVQVYGVRSTWNCDSSLYVGNSGNGVMSITDSGTVRSDSSYLGFNPGSSGVVSVEGTGAMWVGGSLHVGESGSGRMDVTDGGYAFSYSSYIGNKTGSTGHVKIDGASSKWVADTGALYVGYSGNGTLSITGGSFMSNSSSPTSYIGYASGSTGMVTVDGIGSTLKCSGIVVGYSGNSTLKISGGGLVTSSLDSRLCYRPGSTAKVWIDGAGSQWNLLSDIYVGDYGSAVVDITRGGMVSDGACTINRFSTSSSIVTVKGLGSTWTNRFALLIGGSVAGSGQGTLNILDGGTVTASGASFSNNTLVAIDVGTGSKLGLDGPLMNNGKIRILAGAKTEASETYSPISAGMWSGSGVYQAVGGTWNASSHEFTASAVESGFSGLPLTLDLFAKQRVFIQDPGSGWTLGASFAAASSSKSLKFTATAIEDHGFVALAEPSNVISTVLGKWSLTAASGFTAGDPAYLSFDIGSGYSLDDLQIWNYNGTSWMPYESKDINYDGKYVNFMITNLSSYAVTAVPEPCTFALLAFGLIGLSTVAWRKRGQGVCSIL